MDDFEIEIMDMDNGTGSALQLPLNYLAIGEIDNDDVRVYIKQDVYSDLEKYASSDTSNELGTILIGEYSDEIGKMHVVISDFIYAKYTDASASTLTFTHDTWDYIHREHENRFPDKKIIGWQHTHPGYGIFLSNYDMFIQENFFNLGFQVAYVIDPIQHLRGFFQWKNGRVEKLKGFYIYDDLGKQIKTEQISPKSTAEKKEVQSMQGGSKIQTIIITILSILTMILFSSTIILFNNISIQGKNQKKYVKQIEEQKQLLSEQDSEIEAIKTTINQLSTENEIEKNDYITDSKDENEEKLVNNNENEEKDTKTEKKELNNQQVIFSAYTVQQGDSLAKICDEMGVDYLSNKKIILSINGIEDANQIYVGQTILFPINQ